MVDIGGMKDRNILGNILEILDEIGLTVLVAVVLSAFLVCLVAPMLKNVLCNPLILKKMKAQTDEEFDNLNTQMTMIKVGLWVIAIVSWSILLGVNFVHFVRVY
jgi:multidrug efflux pump subunit AcrB